MKVLFVKGHSITIQTYKNTFMQKVLKKKSFNMPWNLIFLFFFSSKILSLVQILCAEQVDTSQAKDLVGS
jgi:hypothetical protein